jgi:hypothetical protein
MIEKIKALKDTLTEKQLDEAARILSPIQMDSLRQMIDADNDNCDERASNLKELLSASPLAALRLYNILSKEQKDIIKEMMKQ